MAESMESLYRRGSISKPAILRRTKPGVPLEMTPFNSKEGRRDQGGRHDRGDVAGSSRSIDHKQDMGTPARASGAPTKGSGAGGQKQPTRRAHIDAPGLQKPKFPAGGKVKRGKAKWKTPKAARGKTANPSAPSEYGGPGENRKYG